MARGDRGGVYSPISWVRCVLARPSNSYRKEYTSASSSYILEERRGSVKCPRFERW